MGERHTQDSMLQFYAVGQHGLGPDCSTEGSKHLKGVVTYTHMLSEHTHYGFKKKPIPTGNHLI